MAEPDVDFARAAFNACQSGDATKQQQQSVACQIILLHAEIGRLNALVEWRPIETAPRDGTWFIAARFVKGCKHARYGYAAVDRWHGREINPDDTYTGLGRFNTAYWPATHWMPLPPLPLSTRGEAR